MPCALVECAHLAPGLYRNVDTGAVVEVRRPEDKRERAEPWLPGLRFGRAVRNAPQAFMSLMSPLDEAGQMLVATMLKNHDDL
jgi:hypothetical protein